MCPYWIGKACAASRTSVVSRVRFEGGARVEEFHVVAARGAQSTAEGYVVIYYLTEEDAFKK